jgi:hypothetical protein
MAANERVFTAKKQTSFDMNVGTEQHRHVTDESQTVNAS